MLTKSAVTVWKHLDGICCLYKPPMVDSKQVCGLLRTNLTNEINEMECRPPRKYVQISGDTSQPLHVEVRLNYADHPLLIGPRYLPRDIKLQFATNLETKTSGVSVVGLGRAAKKAFYLRKCNYLSTFRVTGEFGVRTDNSFSDGKIKFRCNYKHIKKHNVDTAVSAIQAIHQKNLLSMTGVHPQSQEAYELLSKGIIRPTSDKYPVIYSIKCLKIDLPYFFLEIVAANALEKYLLDVVDEIGLRLKNVATTTAITCIRYSSFTVENALLKKHWTLQNVFDNMKLCSDILQKNKDLDIYLKNVELEEKGTNNEDFCESEEELDFDESKYLNLNHS